MIIKPSARQINVIATGDRAVLAQKLNLYRPVEA